MCALFFGLNQADVEEAVFFLMYNKTHELSVTV